MEDGIAVLFNAKHADLLDRFLRVLALLEPSNLEVIRFISDVYSHLATVATKSDHDMYDAIMLLRRVFKYPVLANAFQSTILLEPHSGMLSLTSAIRHGSDELVTDIITSNMNALGVSLHSKASFFMELLADENGLLFSPVGGVRFVNTFRAYSNILQQRRGTDIVADVFAEVARPAILNRSTRDDAILTCIYTMMKADECLTKAADIVFRAYIKAGRVH